MHEPGRSCSNGGTQYGTEYAALRGLGAQGQWRGGEVARSQPQESARQEVHGPVAKKGVSISRILRLGRSLAATIVCCNLRTASTHMCFPYSRGRGRCVLSVHTAVGGGMEIEEGPKRSEGWSRRGF